MQTNEPLDVTQIGNTDESRFAEDGREIVSCPHCGTDCHWESTESGWILVNLGSDHLSLEDSIHYCPKHPDAIEFDEEDLESPENLGRDAESEDINR